MAEQIFLKKNEDKRILQGHPWIYSNEINTTRTPLKNFHAGQEVSVYSHQEILLGSGYINPHSLISIRLFAKDKVSLDETFITNKLKTALRWRETFFKKPFYRWCFGESDQLPGLVIDRYGSLIVAQLNTAGMEAKKELIVAAILTCLPDTSAIVLRNDSGIRLMENLSAYVEVAWGHINDKHLIEENNARFYMPTLSGQKTGWFYDHRANRLRLQDYVHNKKVLDVFSYLGAWGLQAAMYGATNVTCIDASEPALQFVSENFQLNNVTDKLRIIADDAFNALKVLAHQKEKFDVIILDPPAFIKKQKDSKEGLLAYLRLNTLALKLLNPGGILFSCSCSMHLGMDDLMQLLQQASNQAKVKLQILERGHQAQDHPVHPAIPETDYLKMIIARVISE